MQNSNEKSSLEEPHTISLMPGISITLGKESVGSYLEMRAAQLSALNHLFMSADFEAWNDTIKSDAKWLAASLAAEVSQLVSVVTFRENLTIAK